MASITITIDDIINPFRNTVDFEPGEMAEALSNVAGIIESAIENAFGTEAALEMASGLSLEITYDEEEEPEDDE